MNAARYTLWTLHPCSLFVSEGISRLSHFLQDWFCYRTSILIAMVINAAGGVFHFSGSKDTSSSHTIQGTVQVSTNCWVILSQLCFPVVRWLPGRLMDLVHLCETDLTHGSVYFLVSVRSSSAWRMMTAIYVHWFQCQIRPCFQLSLIDLNLLFLHYIFPQVSHGKQWE